MCTFTMRVWFVESGLVRKIRFPGEAAQIPGRDASPGPSRCSPWLGIGVTDESGCRSRVAPPRLKVSRRYLQLKNGIKTSHWPHRPPGVGGAILRPWHRPRRGREQRNWNCSRRKTIAGALNCSTVTHPGAFKRVSVGAESPSTSTPAAGRLVAVVFLVENPTCCLYCVAGGRGETVGPSLFVIH